MKWLLFAVLLLCAVNSFAAPGTLDELLDLVRKERIVEKEENQEREKKFLEARDKQQALLDQAKEELVAEQERGKQLQHTFEENEQTLDVQEKQLSEMTDSLGELETVFRQIAADSTSTVKNSLTSVGHSERWKSLQTLSELSQLPSVENLENLWETLVEETVETGKIVRFPMAVITADGHQQQQDVTRIGTFNVISNGRYLRHIPATGQLAEPARQPSRRYTGLLDSLEQSQSGTIPIALDPTRGMMLDLLVQTPDFITRIKQGGIVGYIIVALGIMGLLIAFERFVVLSSISGRVKRQIKDPTPNPDNPLGRVLTVPQKNQNCDVETLGLKLEEAILKEIPTIKRGLGALSVFASITPLLGLLGTVVGIIATFQSITLFGTGDPRLMSGGISLALVTTVMGLVAAIPILLLHSFLTGKGNYIIQVLDEKSAALVASNADDGHS